VEAFLGTGPPPLTTKHPNAQQVPVANSRASGGGQGWGDWGRPPL